jgi:hypothetical protein
MKFLCRFLFAAPVLWLESVLVAVVQALQGTTEEGDDARARSARPCATRPEADAAGITVSLDAGSILSLEGDRRGLAIRSLGGAVWVTQDDDAKDHVLTALAPALLADRLGCVVVQAVEDASVRITAGKLRLCVRRI